MASSFQACLPLLFIVISSMSGQTLGSRPYHIVPPMVQKRIDSRMILFSMGVSTPKMEYYRRRSMVYSETRLSPGGPDPQHDR